MVVERVVAIDVGKWVSGIALFDGEELGHAFEVKITPLARRSLTDHQAVDAMARLLVRNAYSTVAEFQTVWVAEKMVDYDGKGARERDLEHLRKVLNRTEELLATQCNPNMSFLRVKAHTWKGNVPKNVTAHRVRGILSEEEFGRIRPWTKETWDAVGIGLYQVGRAGRGSAPVSQG